MPKSLQISVTSNKFLFFKKKILTIEFMYTNFWRMARDYVLNKYNNAKLKQSDINK